MSFTNAQLATKIADLITYWSSFNEEYSNWVGGEVAGGPNSDGEYPLTNWAGEETLLPCPALLSDDVTGYVATVAASAATATAAAAAAAASETAASGYADTATAQAVLADADRVAAEAAAATATNEAVTAVAQAAAALASAAAALISETNAAASEAAAAASAAAAAASAAEAATFDPALFAALADDEVITGKYTIDNALGIVFKKLGDADTGSVYYDGASLRLLNNRAGGSIYLENNTYILNSGSFIVQGGLATVQTADTLSKMYYRAQSDHNYIDSVGNATSLRLKVAGTEVVRVAADGLSVYDPLGTDCVTQSHDGADFNFDFTNTADWNINDMTGAIRLYNGVQLDFRNIANDKYFVCNMGSSNFSWTAYGAVNWDVEGLTGDLRIRDGAGLKLYNAADSQAVHFDYTGAFTGAVSGYSFDQDVTAPNLNVSNWDTAYGWGDHATANYMSAGGILSLGASQATLTSAAPFMKYAETGITGNPVWWWGADGGNFSLRLNNTGSYGITFITNAGNDAITSVSIPTQLTVTGAVTGSNLNVSNWDTAYGWGDHSGAYLPISGGTMTGSINVNGYAINANSTYMHVIGTHANIAGVRLESAGGQVGYLYGDGTYMGLLNDAGAWSFRCANATKNFEVFGTLAVTGAATSAGLTVGGANGGHVNMLADTSTSDEQLAPGTAYWEGRGGYSDWTVQPYFHDLTFFRSSADTIANYTMRLLTTGVQVREALTVGGTLGVSGNVTIDTDGVGPMLTLSDGAGASGDELLKFSTDRPWVFRQGGTGASTSLDLRTSNDGKWFNIQASDGDYVLRVLGSTTAPAVDVAGVFSVSGQFNLNTNSHFTGISNGEARLTTTHGYLEFGPKNVSWCHMYTDRASFYFNKGATFVGDLKPSADSTYDLGTSSLYYALAYIDDLKIQSTGDITKTSHGNYLYHASTAYDNDQNGQITFGTGSASGGTTGDIHFKYV